MGTSSTTNYGWIYPLPFEEDDAWGPILNNALIDIDTDLKAVADSKQPIDPQLTALAGVTAVSDALPYFTGATTAAVTTLTAAGRALIDDADAAAQRTTLGLGALAVLNIVNTENINGLAVGQTKIAEGAVSTSKLADLSVTTGKIEDGSVTTAKVADGAVTAAKLAAGVIPEAFPAGTKMLFQQTNAPTGWTKDTAHNNKALRVVSGAAGSGGSWNFTDVFINRGISGSTSANTISASVDYHTLSWNEMPSHNHIEGYVEGNGGSYGSVAGPSGPDMSVNGSSTTHAVTSSSGASWGHTHGFSQSAHSHSVTASLDMAVAYVDLIIATKN